MSFWDIIWFIFVSYLFFAYLLVFFRVITDLFRDRELGGVAKAVWFVAMIFLPVISLFVYVVSRGRGMAERSIADMHAVRSQQEAYIKEVAGTTPAAQISQAKALLDSGAITRTEFETLKVNAISANGQAAVPTGAHMEVPSPRG